MTYSAPTSLQDALGMLARESVTVVAGGTDFYPALKPGGPERPLLDITRITDLSGIEGTEAGWRIGAATRWSDIARADLPAAFHGLQAAAREVGSIQIQNAGTIAGNLCNASPAADGVPPLLTLVAQVELSSAGGTRVLPLSEFILGVRKTALRQDEIVSAILIPEVPIGAGSAFEKLGARRYLVISITMVAAVISTGEDGLIDQARVAVGACSPVAQRLAKLEADLIGQRPEDAVITETHLDGLSPIDDVRGQAEFRLDVVAEQVQRAILKAAQAHG